MRSVTTRRPGVVPRILAVLASAAIVAACGSDDQAATTTSSSEPTTTTAATSSTSTSTTSATTEPSTTTTESATTTTSSTLPGTAFDLAPEAGSVLSVIGVRYDDELNVRSLPGTDQTVVATLAPTADDFAATGQARRLTRSIWFEVETADGTIGWVSSRFVAQAGPTFDLTSDVVATLGEIPLAETMTDLGVLVAEALDTDPDVPTTITLVVPPTVGDLGEVTYDLIGLGDDAAAGLRLHVFGQTDPSVEGFALKTVEATDLCQAVRGVSQPSGLCS